MCIIYLLLNDYGCFGCSLLVVIDANLILSFLPFNFQRIIRAFLVEEQKIVKKVLKIQKAKEKQSSKS